MVMKHETIGLVELLGTWEPDPFGQILGTGYYRFRSPCGIDGLAKMNGGRFDILAVHAAHPGTGQFRRWIKKVMERFTTVCVWQIENAALEAALLRYGFTPEVEVDRSGETLSGMRWDRPLTLYRKNGMLVGHTGHPITSEDVARLQDDMP